MSMKDLNGASNPERNPAILPYMHFTLQERRKVAVLQRRLKFLQERGSGDHDKAESSALSWALGVLANTAPPVKRCEKCNVSWTAEVNSCPECGDRVH